MTISITEARKFIGEANRQYSDEEIGEIILTLTTLADLTIDDSLSKRKERSEEA